MRKIAKLADIREDGLAVTMLGTDWCTYCGRTKKAIAEVSPGLPDVEFSYLDGDDDPDILTSLGKRTYPQVLLHRDGQLVAQRESADAETLRGWLAENGVS